MKWTPHLTHDWRDMSVETGLGYEATPCSDGASIHAWRDMSVEKPPEFRATHVNDLDTVFDSRLAGYELHTPPDESSRPPTITEMTIFLTPPIIVNGHTT